MTPRPGCELELTDEWSLNRFESQAELDEALELRGQRADLWVQRA